MEPLSAWTVDAFGVCSVLLVLAMTAVVLLALRAPRRME